MNSKVERLSGSSPSSARKVNRRSLLGMIGIGAGVGAAMVLLPLTPAEAQCRGGVCVGSGDITGAPSNNSAKKLRTKSPTRKSTKSR